MQKRRDQQKPQTKNSTGEKFEVPSAHWDALEIKELRTLCENALAELFSSKGIIIHLVF